VSSTIHIIVNGEEATLPENCTLPRFLESRGQALARVVVEYNGKAMTPGEAEKVILKPGDRLEIVRIVAGG